eukprot:CAMPEP_0194373644 /NCGR_PEP_ID=MMETSP0174-20130528/22134_1 /TAXON_ID=216777 /ORGANISM="Proboscia alata, Strain PI-D3" /LENGTH=322 /DNA_ID=CAMNT_0039152869 /DNA_START=159 /DNA_END=1124 /DNA_ORIENTATION=+
MTRISLTRDSSPVTKASSNTMNTSKSLPNLYSSSKCTKRRLFQTLSRSQSQLNDVSNHLIMGKLSFNNTKQSVVTSKQLLLKRKTGGISLASSGARFMKDSQRSKSTCFIAATIPDRLMRNKNNQIVRSRNSMQLVNQLEISPVAYLMSYLKSSGQGGVAVPYLSVREDFFLKPTEEQMAAYGHDLIEAIRKRDIDFLRSYHENGNSLQCCNRFGESLIHMACRRGFVDVVQFLTKEAGVSLRVRDDFGRTPMHDACWTCEPNFELLDLLIASEPDLLVLSDKRGSTPFDYVRKEHWSGWMKYLEMNKQKLVLRELTLCTNK